MTDTTFQKQHIEYPLMIYYSDEDFPLDILEKSINDSNAYTFIDMANDLPPGLNDTNLYHIHISQNTDTIYYQKITKSNNINITYTFLRAEKSYKLFSIEDNTD
ncbi:MAG: hypothetical protein BGO31_09950 [Bacteroidetes bacterium 43-16]|nr:MAG: hypothetical protein BGO31_09950 [Bacteroidetes bacterium 43-16]